MRECVCFTIYILESFCVQDKITFFLALMDFFFFFFALSLGKNVKEIQCGL